MSRNPFTLLACCAIAAVLIVSNATAASTGILAGTVTDLEGNGIPGASVSLYRGQNLVILEKNPQTTIGDAAIGRVGHYGFRGLAPGRYNIVIRKSMGAGQEYKVEQQVTVTAGAVVQDFVLDIPEPTSQPMATYDPFKDAPRTDGFGALIALASLAGAVFLARRRER